MSALIARNARAPNIRLARFALTKLSPCIPRSTCEVTAVDRSPSMSRLITPTRWGALASSVAAAACVAQSTLSARIRSAEPAGDHIFVING